MRWTSKREAGDLADGGDHGGADGQVWYKVAVHDIEVEHGGAALLDLGDLLAQTGEIRSQNGWKDFDHWRDSFDFSMGRGGFIGGG